MFLTAVDSKEVFKVVQKCKSKLKLQSLYDQVPMHFWIYLCDGSGQDDYDFTVE